MSKNKLELLQVLVRKCPILSSLQKSIILKWTKDAEKNMLGKFFFTIKNESFSQATLINIVNSEKIQTAIEYS